MKPTYYKYCMVPQCKSTTLNTPNKLFVYVPNNKPMRKKWLTLARRSDANSLSINSRMYFCEDHFDLPNDMLNYTEYHIMGKVSQVRMKPGCTPSNFGCQEDREHQFQNDSLSSQQSPMPCKNVTKMPSTRTCDLNDHVEKKSISSKKSDTSNEEMMSLEESTAISDNMCEIKAEPSSECRTCLQTLSSDEDLHYIFQNWASPWEGVEETIADALQQITQVQFTQMDPYSKFICGVCCQKLQTACLFATVARQSDYALRQRCSVEPITSVDERWPKPIQIDKDNPFHDQMQIKQEELSQEEYNNYSRAGDGDEVENDVTNSDNDTGTMEIKIEPVELLNSGHRTLPVHINGHDDGTSSEAATPEVNGVENSSEQCSVAVKEEPLSDNESAGADLSLDCMLCTKVFKSVSGLKAHVIAQHSYKTVRRKAANEPSPVKRRKHKHACATCKRTFATSTDLMVHETCHNMSVCYGCNGKFDSFESVMQHRLVCAAAGGAGPARTLEDVRRSRRLSAASDQDTAAELLKCNLCGESFSDNYYMNIHLEIHHSSLTDGDMEVEALENMFTERA